MNFVPLKFALACACLLWVTTVTAGEKKHEKVIDFEDEVVEGMNKRPWDSLSQVSEKNKRKHKMHLYRKRGSFRSENSETMKVLGYDP